MNDFEKPTVNFFYLYSYHRIVLYARDLPVMVFSKSQNFEGIKNLAKSLFEPLAKIDKDTYELVFEFLNSANDEEYLLEKLSKIVENIIYPNKLSNPFIWQSEKKIL